MTRFLIGTGGWAYFHVPNVTPLVAYSKAFNFVEVNSTFYMIPELRQVKSWRNRVPSTFEFAVRCNQALTHQFKFEPIPEAFKLLEQMITICRTLRTEMLHFQTPPHFHPTRANSEIVQAFFASANLGDVRPVFELRSKHPMDPNFAKVMQDLDCVHSVDLLQAQKSIYRSDILYSRLFGKGFHNIYQPLDNELKEVDNLASRGNYQKVALTFHSNRMFKDAARFQLFKETGEFPMITTSTGVSSLAEVLHEDAVFPTNKESLVLHQGWKVIDLTKDRRVHASFLLRKIPEKTYTGIEEIVQMLETPT